MSEGDAAEGPGGDGAEGTRPRMVVGVGASAGGLEALQAFFSHLPTPTGMAFVVLTHQHRGQASMLPELLAKHTELPVLPVEGRVTVEADKVYVAVGGDDLSIVGGALEPAPPGDRLPHLPIDLFFRSLAEDCGRRAAAVVLSGTGSDGTLGAKAIKAAGGLVMAQTPESARYLDMPANAIATGLVDYVREPGELPGQLLNYADNPNYANPRVDTGGALDRGGDWLEQVFGLLRDRTGHDFSAYKQSTIRRRIERRMNVHQLATVDKYVRLLQTSAIEIEALFKELLIGVTSLFRDPEVFTALRERILPALIASRPEGYTLRVWVPGCSTGEEAYSLAIVMQECIESASRRLSFQLFATDLDPEAIDIARAGVYSEGIAADVAPARLERFFVHEDDRYRIRKDLREKLIFAPHNLIDDPAFTKLDLLSCRNLLIYLDSSLQQRLLPLFHYALRPGGVLVLGSSESIGSFADLFETLDKKWKIFRRRDSAPETYVTELPASKPREAAGGFVVRHTEPRLRPSTVQLAERALLRELVPPSVLVDARGELVHVHGRTGLFLEPAPGDPARANVLDMAREGLAIELAAALRLASREAEPVIRRGVQVGSDGGAYRVDVHVRRLQHPAGLRGLFLISFEGAAKLTDASVDAAPSDENASRYTELERELLHTRESHQSTVEELETANEELQSTNEELQSANEELETSKEEMQSLNEELQTVNAELQTKVEALSRANDDMHNLLNGTDIATIFLDSELNIKRYTERAKKVINLIPTDVGRAIADLVSKLEYDRLVEDARAVLDTLVFRELEVRCEDGTWYLMRMVPYRTADNVVEGLVITFADITRIRRLEETAAQLQRALESSPTTVYGQDAELRCVWAYGPVFGQAAEAVVGKRDEELLEAGEAERLTAVKRRVLSSGIPVREYFELTVADRGATYYLYVEPMVNAGARGVATVITELDDRWGPPS